MKLNMRSAGHRRKVEESCPFPVYDKDSAEEDKIDERQLVS
jgi:hypothetical protein